MKQHIHFIGIGGIGVSALAKYYLKKRWRVSGSDLAASEITLQMQDLGAEVHIGKPRASLISRGLEKVVYSPAVPKDHLELLQAYKLQATSYKLQVLSYPQALGELTKKHFTIAVSGTHGKSTTTAMIGLLLTKAGLDPTVIVGTKLKEFGNSIHSTSSGLTLSNGEGSNCRVAKSKYLVIEADEYADSFLNYTPQIAVLTCVEADHLDYFKTFSNMMKSFKKYLGRVKTGGAVVANKDDKGIQQLIRMYHAFGAAAPNTLSLRYYSQNQPEAKKLKKVLRIPGNHNVMNALAALTAARILKIPDATSIAALAAYQGSWRRFETFQLKTLDAKRYTLVSDYGHHPTEIKVTVEAAREKWPTKNIWLVYQPHQYQRTYYLFSDFVKVLSKVPVQRLLLLDIYDVVGREQGSIRKKVSSAKLAEAIKKKNPSFEVLHTPEARDAEKYLAKNLKGGEVVMVMGAGNIYQNLTLRLTHSL